MSKVGFICPECGCDTSTGVTSLDGWDDDLLNGYVFADVTCKKCGCEYTNTYKFVSQEITHKEEEGFKMGAYTYDFRCELQVIAENEDEAKVKALEKLKSGEFDVPRICMHGYNIDITSRFYAAGWDYE